MGHAAAVEWERAARTALSEAGHRTGGAREAVVSLLGRQSCCLSAQEIWTVVAYAKSLRKSSCGPGVAYSKPLSYD